MNTSYESDVVAWAKEQAALIRAGQFDQLDLTHIAEEIEDVGKSIPLHTSRRLAELSGVAGALDKDGYLLQAQP